MAENGQQTGTFRVKSGMAQMLKGGVIMDVVNAEQARLAEEAGAVAEMGLERVPADIRAQGGVARMSDPEMIRGIQEAVSIPVMAKARIGHFVEAQVLEALEVDYVDESEVLTPADEANHVDKWAFEVPFVCGATNLGEALRRIGEGAAMIRSKGEAGTGNVVEAVRHMRAITGGIRRLTTLGSEELMTEGPARIGVLALQGDVREHVEILNKLGVEPVEVRGIEDLEGLAGLIVPGGESTAIGNLMVNSGLLDGVRSFFYKGGPVWGTCAGMVLAASATTGPRQPLLGLMNALVERNGFGRQVHSFEKELEIEGFEEPFVGVFIRAPFFEDVGPGVEVMGKVDGRIVAAKGENILVTAFHPELTDDTKFHEYFIREVCGL